MYCGSNASSLITPFVILDRICGLELKGIPPPPTKKAHGLLEGLLEKRMFVWRELCNIYFMMDLGLSSHVCLFVDLMINPPPPTGDRFPRHRWAILMKFTNFYFNGVIFKRC